MLAFRPAAAVPAGSSDDGRGASAGGGVRAAAAGMQAAAPVTAAAAVAAKPVEVVEAVPAAAPVMTATSASISAPVPTPAPTPAPTPTPVAAPVAAAPVVVLAAAEPSLDGRSSAAARAEDAPPWAVDDAPVRTHAAPAPDTAVLAPESAMALPPDAVAAAPMSVPVLAAAAAPVPQEISAEAPFAPASAEATPASATLSASTPTSDSSTLIDDGRIADAEQWLELVTRSGLNGPSRQLAANAAFIGHRDGVLRLALAPGFEYLNSERSIANLAQALAPVLGDTPRIVIETGSADVETLHERANRQKGERQSAAESAFMNDPNVQQLIQQQGARVVPDSIRPYDE
ncbi:DNA polymerase III subunit gamma/tau, partial [Xanthomonas vesicatoria]